MANSIAYLVDQDPWGEPDLDTAMNTDFGAGNWDKLSYTTSVFTSQYKFIYIDGSDQNTAFESFIETNTLLIENWVAAGGRLFINAAVNYDQGNNISVGFGAQLSSKYSNDAADFAYAADPNSRIVHGPDGNAGTSWSGDYFSQDIVIDGNLTPLILGDHSYDGAPITVLGYEQDFLGWVTIGGMTSPYFHSPQPQSAILEANILAFAAGVSYIIAPPATPGITGTPSITGTGQTWYDEDYNAFAPLSDVTIGDTNPGATDSVTITLTAGGVASDANGILSGTNLTKTGIGAYTLAAATPQTLTNELYALVFTPTDGEVPLGQTVTTGVTIAVSDNGLTATDSSTAINVTAERPYAAVYGADGAPGVARLVSGRGGAAPAVTATAYSIYDAAYVNPPAFSGAVAIGGNGGAGANATSPQSSPGSGGSGGGATATATLIGSPAGGLYYPAGGLYYNVTAGAEGGHGGSGGLNNFAVKGGNGGNGGSATASANNPFGDASAGSLGGTGGTASGTGATGGAGGQVAGTSATAANSSLSSQEQVTASATQEGGDGGAGVQGANGGSGASSTLVNAVSAEAYADTASLGQSAYGGAGGDSDGGHGGNGGYAISDLTTGTEAESSWVTVSGAGGRGGAGAIGGNGGATWDAATVRGGIDTANVTTNATGGSAGTNGLAGGDAQAKATAAGLYDTEAYAYAHGGLGQTIAGIANASATGTGLGGTVTADTDTGLFAGNLITEVYGNASAAVDGTNTALSQAGIATTMPSNPGGAIAYIDALPVAAYAGRAEAGAPATIAALGATPNVVAMGEIGGAHSTQGTDSQTSTATIGLTMDLLQLTSTPDLFLGFYGVGASGSAGVTDISLTVQANGATLLSEDFTSTAAAKSWFSDHPIDLGSLGSGPLAVNTSLNLQIGMSVTTDQAGSGFSSYLVLGHG